MEKQHKRHKKQKVATFIPVPDIDRLKTICDKYGYKSIYKLLQYLVYCFLRVADPGNDPILETVPDDIREMFISPLEYKRLKKRLKNGKSRNVEIQLLIPYTEYKTKKLKQATLTKKGVELSIEINQLFSDNAEWEKTNHLPGSHTGMVVKKKPDQRKIQTVDDLK